MVQWSALNFQALEEAEKKLISLSGVNITTQRIPINEYHSIYCLMAGESSNPPLVLLHGYLGMGMMFFKILRHLALHYRVYCLDLLGMGRSSRPNFTAKGHKESEEFFTKPLEVCRQYLGLEKMILCGHSFGGYIAGCYTEEHPDRVEKLILISPAGVSKVKENEPVKKLSFFQNLLHKFSHYLWRKNITPATILRKIGPFGKKFVNHYLTGSFRGWKEEELALVKIYFQQVNLCPGSGEHALPEILREFQYAYSPLCDRLKNVPILFLYGDTDWMKIDGAHQNKEINSQNVVIEIVSNAGHQLYFDNPKETAEKIFSGLAKLDEVQTA
ncbi:unnamed protein product [Blepharisma stoltei]|uniref:AB hydrolase-1 domain-containing protein n=1 Tax=Blepharisma stoltei TaxID=1481888 RepID=A0AAU9KE32_9CILI|nr:unnamed protein product [Blepharisma stoltei]